MRKNNSELRPREHLLNDEVEMLLRQAKKHGKTEEAKIRNYTLILLSVNHGLRVTEATGLKWIDVNMKEERIFIRRKKGSLSGTHPLLGEEVKALKKLRNAFIDSSYLFPSERGGEISRQAINLLLNTLWSKAWEDKAKKEKLLTTSPPFPIHPHMLRHTCGFRLTDKGINFRVIQDYLGHRSPSSTQIYTALSANAFNAIWD